jgi:hypothetical protein
MLIKELKENPEDIERWNNLSKQLQKEYPEENFDRTMIKSLSDRFEVYENWLKEVKEENIKTVEDIGDVSGVFVCFLNFEHDVDNFTQHHLKCNWDDINYYGVCDNASQLIEYYNKLIANKELDNNKTYGLFLVPHFKSSQPEKWGWRWEKWGEYIGVQKSVSDYLYDEPNIEMVYSFNIYEIDEHPIKKS